MSGRKRAEVEAVLRDAAAAQRELFERRLSRCDDLLSQIDKLNRAGADRRAASAGLVLDAAEPARARGELDSVRVRLRDLGAAMDGLEQQMRGRTDSWYFDQEFEEGKALEGQYRDLLAGRVRPLQARLEAHCQTLQSAQAAWERKIAQERAAAETAVAALEQKVRPAPYHPLDPDRTLDLEAFCSEVLQAPEEWSGLQARLQALRARVDAGRYGEALQEHRRLDAEADDLLDRVQAEHQALRRMATTAVEVREALKELGYRVGSELMGQRLADGIRVRTVETDRPVHFDVGLEAQQEAEEAETQAPARVGLSFNVDGLGAQCGTHAARLLDRLRRQGILIRVTDWGRAGTEGPAVSTEQARETGKDG